MDDHSGHSGEAPLSPRDSYARQHNAHRHEQRHSEAERVLAAQHHHQQPHRQLNVPALAAALPAWSREAADTLFAFLERGDNAQAAASMSEALPGLNFPALSAAGRTALIPHGGPLHSQHPLHHPSPLSHLQQQHPAPSIQRRGDDQPSSALSSEHYAAQHGEHQNLLAQYHMQSQPLAAAPRWACHLDTLGATLAMPLSYSLSELTGQ